MKRLPRRIRKLCRRDGKFDIEIEKDGQALFRDVFLSDVKGKQVLELLGLMLHAFDDTLDSEEELICTNIWRKILRACGIWDREKSNHIMEVLSNVGYLEPINQEANNGSVR